MSQKVFWAGELKAFLDNSAKKEMIVEHGGFSLRGNAYGRMGFRAGEEIITSPVRLLKRVYKNMILVKTMAGYVYCIWEDGYSRAMSPELKSVFDRKEKH